MFKCSSRNRDRMNFARNGFQSFRTSGNSAFDAYKTETLRRLEDEQKAFEDFLTRLRESKDKAEFDQFMDDRARAARSVREGEAPADPA